MAAQTTLTTLTEAGVALVVQPEGAVRGLAEWRIRDTVNGSQADEQFLASITDKGDGKSPLRVAMRVNLPMLDATGQVIGVGSFLGSVIAPANASEAFLTKLYMHGVNSMHDPAIAYLFEKRTKIW